MGASSPMRTVHRGRWIKLYRAEKGVHTYPGLTLWLGPRLGHLRLWPPRIVRG